MTVFIVFLCILLAVLAGVGLFLFVHSRKLLREQKNYERGLKMVPLLIHLPPQSDDTEGGGRDVRDLVDENISKAQVIYNIIASTLQKGFKSQFYGQRHFGFEIVAAKGFVKLYAAVPVSMTEVVKQAIVSAYPSARLEEVPEHNIFSPVGKINGTVGGELTLKEDYAFPIATYQDLKRDAFQSMLNALSTLDKEDGAGIQILMRPANPDWRKHAQGLAGKKRKGDESKKGGALVGEWGKQLGMAVVKPPEDKGGGKSEPKQLSAHEQSTLDAIDQKTSYPGYEVLIRVVASSNVLQRAQAIQNNIIAAFSLFDAQGRNGFKYTPSKDIESFVTAYIMRFFPQENNQSILNTVELATIFHFPDQKNIPTTQLERQSSKQVDGPRNVADEGIFLGYNVFRGVKKPIRLDENDRRRHMYLVGQTGTGKSTMLENLALQDMLNGRGFAFIDPHGDVAEELLAMVPKERTEDVIYFCPADMDYPLGLNLFEFDSPDQKDFLVQEAINMLYKLYDPGHTGIIGPRYEHWFRNAALTVMSNPEGGTFIDIPKVFTDKNYERKLKQYVTDPTVLDFWNKEMAQTSDYHKSEVLGWFVSKFGAFLNNEMMRDIIGQTKSSFNLRQIMDEGKILLVNLSKGRTGDLNSQLLGMIFVMKFQAAAMSRANVPEEERKDFSLYVDEFQNFSTDSFATILSEARKYRLNLIVANQFTTQLTDEIRDAVFGNIGTVVTYRVGTNDAEFLAKQFAPVFDIDDLQRVPNYNAIVRMLIGGIPTQPFSMAAMPKLGKPNKKLMEALKQLSAAKYGRPRAQVDGEIMKRLRSAEEGPQGPAPTAGSMPGAVRRTPPRPGAMPPAVGAPSYGAGTAPQRPAPAKPSFLDDWLRKRQAPAPQAAQPWGPPPVPAAQPAPTPVAQHPVAPAPAPAHPAPPVQSVPPAYPVSAPSAPPVPTGPPPAPAAPATPPTHVAPVPAPVPHSVPAPQAAQPAVPLTPVNSEIPEPIKPKVAANLKVHAPPPDPQTENLVKEVEATLSGRAAPQKAVVGDNFTDATSQPAPDDTIFIDKEGTLHVQQDEDEAKPSESSSDSSDQKPAAA